MNHREHTEPRVYELGYHLVPTIAEEQVPQASDAVRGMIEGISGSIIAEEKPVFIDLAYTIIKVVNHKNKRFDEAYFGFIKFESDPSEIATLEEALKKDENVLRYMVVTTLKENTFISKKFPSSKAKERADGIEEEVVVVPVPEMEAEPVPAVPIEKPASDELDKAIDKLVA